MTSRHGDFHWLELNTRDPEAAEAFYTKVLGWTIETVPMADGAPYRLIKNGDTLVGGIFLMEEDYFKGIPNHWFHYFAVEDIDETHAAVLAAGGEIRRPPFDVPEVGRVMIILDDAGAPLGLMQPAPEVAEVGEAADAP
ncbi:MAG: VOC family protein [Pseudomonadota bacterium]